MSKRNTKEMLQARFAKGLFVCVGLDVDFTKIPSHMCGGGSSYEREMTLYLFLKSIVDATHDEVCAFKPNIAFFARHGQLGLSVLKTIVPYIHQVASDVPVILDAKRGDIGISSQGYVDEAFGVYGADAVTIAPYMGLGDACQPFLTNPDKLVFVLCKTSNAGSGEFQDLMIRIPSEERMNLIAINPTPWDGSPSGEIYTTLANYVAWRVSQHWNGRGNCGLVIGATYPAQLAVIRRIAPDLPLLIPGLGAQGGDHEATVKAAGHSMVINLSRTVLYASSGERFAEAARAEVMRINALNSQYLNA